MINLCKMIKCMQCTDNACMLSLCVYSDLYEPIWVLHLTVPHTDGKSLTCDCDWEKCHILVSLCHTFRKIYTGYGSEKVSFLLATKPVALLPPSGHQSSHKKGVKKLCMTTFSITIKNLTLSIQLHDADYSVLLLCSVSLCWVSLYWVSFCSVSLC
jgi:hypothetical protein